MEWCLWAYRQAYWCRRRLCPRQEPPKQRVVDVSSLPWLWIGVKYPNSNSITVTNVINSEIHPGMCVTHTVLSHITGYQDGTWRYIDPKTLEERDFPSEGFIIEGCP